MQIISQRWKLHNVKEFRFMNVASWWLNVSNLNIEKAYTVSYPSAWFKLYIGVLSEKKS